MNMKISRQLIASPGALVITRVSAVGEH